MILNSDLEVVNSDIGKSLVSRVSISRGSCVLNLCVGGTMVFERTRTSIELTDNVHIEHPLGAFINHSQNPNCVIVNGNVISCKDIPSWEEITTYYPQHESSISHPFKDKKTGYEIKDI